MNTETTIYLPRRALEAMTHLAAVQAVPSFLSGVLVEATAEYTRLVATDGHALGIFQVEIEPDGPNIIGKATRDEQPMPPIFRGILTIEAIALAIKNTRRSENTDIVMRVADRSKRGGKVILDNTFVQIACDLIDSEFPDYTRLIPATVAAEQGHAGQFNPAILAQFMAVARILGAGANCVALTQNGPDKAAMVAIHGEQFVGIVMPMRVLGPTIESVAWAAKSLQEQPHVTANPPTQNVASAVNTNRPQDATAALSAEAAAPAPTATVEVTMPTTAAPEPAKAHKARKASQTAACRKASKPRRKLAA